MNNLTIIGKKNLFGIEVPDLFGGFGGIEKSMLVKTVATIHGREVFKINELINNNRSRFIDGIHLIDLKGHNEVAILLKDSQIYTQDAINASKNIYLLSQRGYIRLLKIMDDDTAWEKWDVIENDYFEMKEQAIKYIPRQRKSSSRLNPALRDALAVAEIMEKLGVKPGIARSAAIRAVEKNTDIDLSDISKCLPAVGHEEIGRLNATEIAERLNIRYKTGRPDPKTINKMLIAASLMVKSDDGKQPYSLTDIGKEIGECVPYTRGGHSGYEIRWNESVTNLLTDEIQEAI